MKFTIYSTEFVGIVEATLKVYDRIASIDRRYLFFNNIKYTSRILYLGV